MRPQATFSFVIFFTTFSFFTLLIAPSSTSLLSLRPSFLLVHPYSSSLLPPRPSSFLIQLSKLFRIRKRPFFIDFDESVTDQPTDPRTDKASYRDARTHLKKIDFVRQSMHPSVCPSVPLKNSQMTRNYSRREGPFLFLHLGGAARRGA